MTEATNHTVVTDVAQLVRADNPNMMTLDGTNTWILRAPGSDSSVVVWVSAAGSAFLAGVAFFAAAAFLAGRATWTASTATVMWQVRLRIRYARPCARGRNRLSVGPSSTNASLTRRASGSSRSLFSAFAIALASTL